MAVSVTILATFALLSVALLNDTEGDQTISASGHRQPGSPAQSPSSDTNTSVHSEATGQAATPNTPSTIPQDGDLTAGPPPAGTATTTITETIPTTTTTIDPTTTTQDSSPPADELGPRHPANLEGTSPADFWSLNDNLILLEVSLVYRGELRVELTIRAEAKREGECISGIGIGFGDGTRTTLGSALEESPTGVRTIETRVPHQFESSGTFSVTVTIEVGSCSDANAIEHKVLHGAIVVSGGLEGESATEADVERTPSAKETPHDAAVGRHWGGVQQAPQSERGD